MALRAAHDRMNAGDQLIAVEWLGDVIVSAEAERADLAVHLANARQDQDRRSDLRGAKFLQHVVAMHVRKIEVEEDDVVVIQLAEIEALFPEIGGVNVKAF